jgi:hypothetical protein
MNAPQTRTRHALTFNDALSESPTMQKLGALIGQSQNLLKSIAHLLPKLPARAVQAGPIDEQGWCLLVTNSAVAAKLRQLVPDIERQLATSGIDPAKVRIKILKP